MGAQSSVGPNKLTILSWPVDGRLAQGATAVPLVRRAVGGSPRGPVTRAVLSFRPAPSLPSKATSVWAVEKRRAVVMQTRNNTCLASATLGGGFLDLVCPTCWRSKEHANQNQAPGSLRWWKTRGPQTARGSFRKGEGGRRDGTPRPCILRKDKHGNCRARTSPIPVERELPKHLGCPVERLE